MTVNLADLLTDEQLRALAEARGFELVPTKQRLDDKYPMLVEDPEPEPVGDPVTETYSELKGKLLVGELGPEEIVVPPPAPKQRDNSTMKAGSTKPKGICRRPGCDNPWMPRTKPGRPPEYCSEECKRENKRKGKTPAAPRAPRKKAEPTPKTPETFAKTSVLQEVIPPALAKCGRCDSPEHSVIDCPVPYRSKKVKQSERRQAVRPQAIRITGTSKEDFAVTTIAASGVRREAPKPVYVHGVGELSDDEIASSGAELAQRWRSSGLPASMGFQYLPDVLALYNLDQDMVEACLRNPDRVELRPESFQAEKRYPVLGFFRGDVNVILGLRDIHHPCVIAVYVTSLLEHDRHRVGHTGGGGAKKLIGPPKTPAQLDMRLRSIGCLTKREGDLLHVTYKGQELGAVRNGKLFDKRDIDSDWNRMSRKVHAIDQREAKTG